MTKIHHLFYSTDTEKQTLHRRIIPNQKQQETQQERWKDLRDYLVEDLCEASGYSISSWLQGSYKFYTQIRPVKKDDEFDIDLGIYFNWSGSPDEGSLSPLELKKLVQKSLLKYKNETDDTVKVMDPPKDRCCRIHFEGDFHIDVPCYHLDENRDARALATENNEWEYSDPKAFYLWFKEKFADDDNSQIRRLIRYLKAWAALSLEKPPSSVLLTVLVAEAYLDFTEEQCDGDDVALSHLSKSLIDRLEMDHRVPNPIDEKENLNRLTEEDTSTLIQKLRELLDISNRALRASTEIDSATIWSELFSYFFPIPKEESPNPENRAIVRVHFEPKVQVTAISTSNKNFSYNELNRIGPIPKKCTIHFNLINSNELPSGAHIQWVVRNEGEEAEYTNDLGHWSATDKIEVEESSAYKGTHYMDVLVTSPVQGVLGFLRIPVEVNGTFIPPRNPKKPGYSKLSLKRR